MCGTSLDPDSDAPMVLRQLGKLEHRRYAEIHVTCLRCDSDVKYKGYYVSEVYTQVFMAELQRSGICFKVVQKKNG